MKKSLLALACAAATLAPLAVAHAQYVALSTNPSHPTVLDLGEIGTVTSFVAGGSVNDYYFDVLPSVAGVTSFLGDANTNVGQISPSVTSLVSQLSGTSLTAHEFGGPVSTSFNLSPNTEYTLAVSGTSPTGTSFFANIAAVSAAPEPATWALMVFGIGAIGVAMRRSRQAARSAVVAA